ncbi:MAG: hypothetical protein PWP57_842 [Candidatus Atribacteria bacterium]|nr:hypothetical protein [Candidatus Atribacteria bacterium]
MRYKVFLDTNILLSGIFFEGNEAKLLNIMEVDLITSEDVVCELKIVAKKKLKSLGKRPLEIALLEIDKALYDVEVLPRDVYKDKLPEAKRLIAHEKDVPILAAALYADVDYLLTGDSHFFTDEIKAIIKVGTTREFLDEIGK